MRALVTGSRGTVGRALRQAIEAEGGTLIPWDRAHIPIDDYGAMLAFIEACAPDALFHLAAASQPTQARSSEEESWRVNYEWSSELAWICRELDLPFVFSSTVMVFEAPGPYSIGSRPDASGGYGREKASAEARIFHQNPSARVARLGWQIGRGPSGNHMSAWAWAQAASRGKVEASLRWIPACSFLDDSARALMELATRGPGLYHVDSNDGHSFYDIIAALRAREGAGWPLVPTWERAFDQRLLESRLHVPRLGERIG